MLANVLLRLSEEVPEVGYCQGMNFVVAHMLKVCRTFVDSRGVGELAALLGAPAGGADAVLCMEAAVFWVMVAIIAVDADPGSATPSPLPSPAKAPAPGQRSSSGGGRDADYLKHGEAIMAALGDARNARHIVRLRMGGLWRPGVPLMKQRIYEFEQLLRLRLPALSAHFRELDLAPDVLVSQWLLTLFAYALSEPLLLRAWDAVLGAGWEAALSVALALLQLHEAELTAAESLEDLGMYLRRCHWGEPGEGAALALSPGDGIPWGPRLDPGRKRTPSFEGLSQEGMADRLWAPIAGRAQRLDVTARELAALGESYAITLMRERVARRTDGLLGRYGESTPVEPGDLALTQAEAQWRNFEVNAATSALMEKVEQRRGRASEAIAAYNVALASLQEVETELEEKEVTKRALLSQVALILGTAKPKTAESPPPAAQCDLETPPRPSSLASQRSDAFSDVSLGSEGSYRYESPQQQQRHQQQQQRQQEEEKASADGAGAGGASASSTPPPKLMEAAQWKRGIDGVVGRASELFCALNVKAKALKAPKRGSGTPAQAERGNVDPQLMADLQAMAAKVEIVERRIQILKGAPLRQRQLAHQEAGLDLQESRDALAAAVASLNFYLEKTDEELKSCLLAFSPEAQAMVAHFPPPPEDLSAADDDDGGGDDDDDDTVVTL